MTDRPDLIAIGWREYVAFPEWGIARIRAKIDTGARTSAIHVHRIEELPGERVRFEVVVRQRPRRVVEWVEADVVRETIVKPSSGARQRRLVCATKLQIGQFTREVEIGLVCRKEMLCRMLVGRTALAGQFVVDPSRKYLLSSRRPVDKR